MFPWTLSEQLFSECGPGTSSTSVTREFVRPAKAQTLVRACESEKKVRGQLAFFILTHFPGDSPLQGNLRTFAMENFWKDMPRTNKRDYVQGKIMGF